MSIQIRFDGSGSLALCPGGAATPDLEPSLSTTFIRAADYLHSADLTDWRLPAATRGLGALVCLVLMKFFFDLHSEAVAQNITRIARAVAAGRARAALAVQDLETIEVVGSQDEREGNGGDDDLAEGADDEGTRSLFEEVA